MTVEEWVKIVVCILAGMATAIPLLHKLVKYIHTSVREKNWDKLIKLVITLMGQAEGMFESGADKKVWVMQALDALSDTIDYDIDKEAVSSMIDILCAMSKVVNAPDERSVE